MPVTPDPLVIPGCNAAEVHAASVTLPNPDGRVTLSVQTEAAGAPAIIRGHGPPTVDRTTFLPVLAPEDGHVARFAATRRDRDAVAITGCGNLMTNPGVRARTASAAFGIPGGVRHGIHVIGGRHATLFDLANEDAPLPLPADVVDPDTFAITGPVLVRGGRARAPDPAEFADLRHLLLPAFVEVVPGVRVDFGLDRLGAAPRQLAAAVRGDPITLLLEEAIPRKPAAGAPLVNRRVKAELLRAALVLKGYIESAEVRYPGEFALSHDAATIAFRPGIYPHHALAIDAAGAPVSVIVSGRSNRAGVSVAGFAEALARAGYSDAILLDNGGDVGLLKREDAADAWRFAVRPSESDRSAWWPLRACLVWHAPTK